jgi:hypothetical protein
MEHLRSAYRRVAAGTMQTLHQLLPTIALLLLLFLPPSAFAQSTNQVEQTFPQFGWGIQLGPNLSFGTSNYSNTKETSKLLPGFVTGPFAEMWFSEKFALDAALLYEQKGGKGLYEGAEDWRLHYLALPVAATYRHPFNNGTTGIVGMGPFGGYGLSGKAKVTSCGCSSGQDLFKDEYGLKRFDGGLNFLVGYALPNHLEIKLRFEWGLLNIQKRYYSGMGDTLVFYHPQPGLLYAMPAGRPYAIGNTRPFDHPVEPVRIDPTPGPGDSKFHTKSIHLTIGYRFK